tara:strand:- start:156 stop:989 length:834 start_codon:yes stop_codon:yes gene_type:complete
MEFTYSHKKEQEKNDNKMEQKFVVFHQPKTGGSFVSNSLPKGYVLDHYNNYHKCLEKKMDFSNTKKVCIIREPVDYLISAITFWCLDTRYVRELKTDTLESLKRKWENRNKNMKIGHPAYWMSNGFTERKLENIIKNIVNDEFINENKDKFSRRHHTHSNYVFEIMSRLGIGYYTYGVLDQCSRKKVSEIKTGEECKEELEYIRDNFVILNQKYLTNQLRKLCEEEGVKCKNVKARYMASKRGENDEELLDEETKKKIYEKERYMLEVFKDYYEQKE